MRTITSPTTSTAYWARAIAVPADRFATGSSFSRLGASPEASCQEPVAPPDPPSRFFWAPSWPTDMSFSELTTDHDPAAVAEPVAATGSRGATFSAAGLGAGVQDGSLGAGIRVGSGAGRNGSGAGGVYAGAGGAGGEAEVGAGGGGGRGFPPGGPGGRPGPGRGARGGGQRGGGPPPGRSRGGGC